LLPNHVTAGQTAARIRRAAALFTLGRFQESLADYDALIAQQWDADLVAYRGDCLRELGDWRAARREYARALRRAPNLLHARANLGALLLLSGRPRAALRHCRRATALAGDSVQSWMNLGQCLFELEQLDEAMDAYAEAFALDPASSLLCCKVSSIWQHIGDYEQAALWLSRAWECEPRDSTQVKASAASLLLETGNSEQAAILYSELRADAPDDVDIAIGFGRALWDEGEIAGSLENLRQASALRPHMAAIRCHIADVLLSVGDASSAEAEQRAALEVNPQCVSAIAGLATGLRGRLPPADAQRAQDLLNKDWLRAGARSALHMGLAHHFDETGDHPAAARHAAEGNRWHWQHRMVRGWRYDPGEHSARIERIIETFGPDLFARFDRAGVNDTRPTFIVGMPRSGTTLTEQILACHPRVLGIGERPFAARSLQSLAAMLGAGDELSSILGRASKQNVRRISMDYCFELDRQVHKHGKRRAEISRVIDKMPDNYELLGWIALVFPAARFIHVRRDPRDIALSCWMQRFGQIRWACDMSHIAERLVQHRRLMAHWREVLPRPLFEFDYEELVEDTEQVSRRLVDFLELPWNPACLDHVRREGAVRTASVNQVRKPIYRSSVGRWRHYADVLAPVLERFPDGAHSDKRCGRENEMRNSA
jgi:tetratricopeptide (TPR) repeat protein